MKKDEKIKKIGKAESKAEAETETKEIKVNDERIVEESKEKVKFREIIEKYKIKNPVKYEHKKEALKKQLAAIK